MANDGNNISESWTQAKLAECVEILDTLRVPVNSDERKNRIVKIPYYGATGQVGWIDDFLFDEELLLLGEDGAPFLDKSKPIAYIVTGKSWVNNHAHVLRAIQEIASNHYLKYFFNQFNFTDYVNGTTRLKLTQGSLKSIHVNLAPLNEQRRIVEKLEKLLERVESAKARLEKIPVLLKRFRQSVLSAACSGKLTEDWRKQNRVTTKFEQTTVEAIADYVGGFAYKSSTFLDSGKHQVIRIGNVRPLALKLDASPVFIPNDIAQQTERFRVLPGDIVISMTGTKYKQDYGYAALIRESDGSLFLNQRVTRLRSKRKVLPKYLLYWLQTDLFREFFFAGETGNVNQGNVGADGIRKAPIELPPLPEQREIVRLVEALFAIADKIEARYQKAKTFVDSLTQSLLAKAFRGELIPQNPSDEPASVLLDRIRAERLKDESNSEAKKLRK